MRFDIGDMNVFREILIEHYSLSECPDLNGLSLDSRNILNNDIFIAINGESVNGHNYIENAISNGASLILCEEKGCSSSICIHSNSNYISIQKLAKKYRDIIDIPMLGITGSNGKTTTKDMIYQIVQEKIDTVSTKKNYNSTLSVPLTTLGLNNSNDLSIIEMGASELGEIKTICDIASPTMGLITNISNAHTLTFRNINNIASTKSKLFESLPIDGYAFKNIDDPFISEMKTKANIVTYGFSKNADYTGSYDGETLTIDDKEIQIKHNNKEMAINSIASYAVTKTLNLDSSYICEKISNFKPACGRKEIIELDNITIINDTYNANLLSAKSGIDLLINHNGKRKIAIIGDMLELGDFEIQEHEKLGEYINAKNIDIVIGVGKLILNSIDNITSPSIEKKYFKTIKYANQYIKELIRPYDVYYIKGSRGMRMEKIIKENFSL